MIGLADVIDGLCGICGEPATLRFRDASTGEKIGRCCLHDLLAADKAISDSLATSEPKMVKPARVKRPVPLQRPRTPDEVTAYQREQLTATLARYQRRNSEAEQCLQAIGEQIELARANNNGEAETLAKRQCESLVRQLGFIQLRIESIREKLTELEAGKLPPHQFFIHDIDIEHGHLFDGTTKRGSGDARPARPAFFTVGDGTDSGARLAEIYGQFSPELGEILTAQAARSSGPKNVSRRMTAFCAPDKKVFVLGTFKRSVKTPNGFRPDYFVTKPTGDKSMKLVVLMSKGYTPFASILTEHATNNPHYVYESREDYLADFGEASAMMEHARARAVEFQSRSGNNTTPQSEDDSAYDEADEA
ncbi:MAG: hypothetical protein JWR26_2917 [Pedosphaera sp.]|nr:hypothetical protein [Pedosphaera sp.]